MHKSMLLLTFLPLCSALILGQTNQMKAGQPPKYLQIMVEEVRAGKMAVHNNLEAEWTDALKKAAIKAHYLGAPSVAGQSEALWLLLHDGHGEIEELREEEATNSALRSVVECYSGQDSDYITGHSTMLARRRDALSYRPDFNFGEYRFLAIHTFHTKLAHAWDAIEVLKILNTASNSRSTAGSRTR